MPARKSQIWVWPSSEAMKPPSLSEWYFQSGVFMGVLDADGAGFVHVLLVGYLLVVQRIDAHHASKDFGGEGRVDGVSKSSSSVHELG